MQLDLEPLQGLVLVQELVAQPGDLRLGLAAHLVQGALQGVDPGRQVELKQVIGGYYNIGRSSK